jgi:crotonobetainyl-CoA:carnitine CoA-transferase CaiB-like acyl-CoA transferase
MTGNGCMIDLSAVEEGVGLLGPIALDVQASGRLTRSADFPTGNRLEHPAAAPHGVYPCSTEDRWLAIAVFDDLEWSRFVAALGDPAWASDSKFGDHMSRFGHQDALDHHIAGWTRTQDARSAMKLLQERGVRASVVQNAAALTEVDPQIVVFPHKTGQPLRSFLIVPRLLELHR